MTEHHTLKRFYQRFQRFKKEHAALLATMQDVAIETTDHKMHVTVLLIRLMFSRFLACTFEQVGDPGGCPAASATSQSPVPMPIHIPKDILDRVNTFFDDYQWRLDTGQPHVENALYPDILGYIFERHTHQKQVGAYYTQRDVTAYIASNTILPYLFETIQAAHPLAFTSHGSIWQPLRTQPERYIHDSVRRKDYLPTETEREYRVRQERYTQICTKLRHGGIATIADFVTYNLDIQQFALDMIAACEQPGLLLTLYHTLEHMTILDPTCGAGAFLLTALNLLELLYDACLERMQLLVKSFSDRNESSHINTFRALLHRTQPDRYRFILTTILNNNLHGVDIMDEAVEVCKMQLFLRLVAQVKPTETMPQWSDIQWHIHAGNALVGTIRAHEQDTIQRCDTSDHNNQQQQFHWYTVFPHVIAQGGFDIIIGNPPYVEYSKVRQDYTVSGYEAESCGNLYAAVVERSLALCHTKQGHIGLIIPLSLCSSERFAPLRKKLIETTSACWLANFEIFPCRLFENAFQRLTILLIQHHAPRRQEASTPYVTRLQRWYASERPHLIKLIAYTPTLPIHPTHTLAQKQVFPKLVSSLQERILHKALEQSQGKSIATLLYPQKTDSFVYYQEATNYWMKATCRIPFYKKDGVVMKPPHGRFLYFQDSRHARAIMALMNSGLFYIWFTTYSDGFHLSHTLVKDFPIVSTLSTLPQLLSLATRLEEDMLRNTTFSTRNARLNKTQFGVGPRIEIAEYNMTRSKPLLDEIDTLLAQCYSFTDEELDFIVHYDSKYRMSKG